MLPINLLSVLIAGVAAFIIGFLAHGPIAGKLWMKLANIHPTGEEKLSDMIPQMVMNLAVNIITAYFIALVYMFVKTSYLTSMISVCTGVMTAFFLWLGFIATSSSIDVIWMGKSFKLWLYEAVSSLVVFLAMGAIIAVNI